MATADSASPLKQNWVLSPISDFLLIIAAPVLGVAWAVISLQTMGEAWALSVFMVFNVAHHFPTWVRIYGDRELFSRFPLEPVVGPAAALCDLSRVGRSGDSAGGISRKLCLFVDGCRPLGSMAFSHATLWIYADL